MADIQQPHDIVPSAQRLHRAVIGEAGRVVTPAPLRDALGLQKGSEVVMRIEKGRLEILSQEDLVARAQAVVRRHPHTGKRRVSEELLAERRQKAKRGA